MLAKYTRFTVLKPQHSR